MKTITLIKRHLPSKWVSGELAMFELVRDLSALYFAGNFDPSEMAQVVADWFSLSCGRINRSQPVLHWLLRARHQFDFRMETDVGRSMLFVRESKQVYGTSDKRLFRILRFCEKFSEFSPDGYFDFPSAFWCRVWGITPGRLYILFRELMNSGYLVRVYGPCYKERCIYKLGRTFYENRDKNLLAAT